MTIAMNLDPHALAKELSHKNLIGGEFVPAVSGRTFDVLNPATMEAIAAAPFSEAADVDNAVRNAAAAQKEWAKRSARERGKLVAECGRVLMERVEEMARLVALETGKAIRTESRPEASVLADVFVFFGGLGSEIKGETIPFSNECLTMTIRQPIGVVGAIIPWNAPLLLMALKIAPALVAGNTVVVKSAEEAPLTVLRVAQVMNEILPAGVFNILAGYGPEAGAPIVEHEAVGKVSFTGSVDTGRIVYRSAANRIIPVTLELGGKSPMIVMADADLDRAVAGAVTSMRFTRQGQSCTAASRMFVHEDLHDEFVERMVAEVNAMKMGDPLDEETDIGSVISQQQYDRVNFYVNIGRDTPGAVAHTCSALPSDPHLAKGLFVRPVIFTGTKNTDRINREEVFGPVTCVMPWSDYEDVIAQANDTEFGLAASIWTNDLKLAMDAVHRIEAGICQVNQNIVVQSAISYGGVKASGLGKEASLESMLTHFTHKKTVIFNMT
jgi:acyl-CoA reductase-like NAD-dependent aldehyde dehydrogenase